MRATSDNTAEKTDVKTLRASFPLETLSDMRLKKIR
jgi:hypothetical protein